LIATDEARRSEAAPIHVKACNLGTPSACVEVAHAYRDGAGPPQSLACATYFAWQACTADDFYCTRFFYQLFESQKD
ncbi:MAG: hypothetical protein ACNA8W_21300, partial [Bradymonadaceae bacterium]